MGVLKKIDDKLEEYVLVLTMIVMLSIVFLQVISRHVINISMAGSEEISRYMLVWIIWISASYAVKKNSHIRVRFFQKLLPDIFKKPLELLVLTLWFLFSLFLAINGTELVQNVQMTGQTSPSNRIPIWIIYLIIPIAGCLMGARVLQQAYLVIKGENLLARRE